MDKLLNVRGLSELQKVLDTLPIKLEKNVLRGSLRAGVNVIKPVAKANITSRSGLLARGLQVGTRSMGGKVIARLRATGRHAFIAPWLEFGTAAHEIRANPRRWLVFRGIFAKRVQHPGSKSRPFLRPAMDSQAGAAVVAAAEYMKTRLADKHGLDTSHVLIEGDEP